MSKKNAETVESPVVETSKAGVAVFEEGQHPRALRKAAEVKAAEETTAAAETPAKETPEEE